MWWREDRVDLRFTPLDTPEHPSGIIADGFFFAGATMCQDLAKANSGSSTSQNCNLHPVGFRKPVFRRKETEWKPNA
jgi:hypothetical protein